MKNSFVVIGNPIKHSLSPRIYEIFSQKNNIHFTYGKILSSLDDFENVLLHFFLQGGLGANVTIPFKERAFLLCHKLTDRGFVSGAVNTIKKQDDGILYGDNTDGIGLIYDLKRLKFLFKNVNNNILLIGAGGAAKGIIPSLLMYGCKIIITNRTFSRAQKLADLYKFKGDITALSYDLLNTCSYNLIINATSSSIYNCIPDIPISIINPKVFCYDLYYQKYDTPFISWCYYYGALYCSDGLGMLVSQAAYSFLFWHNILPCIDSVLEILRLELTS